MSLRVIVARLLECKLPIIVALPVILDLFSIIVMWVFYPLVWVNRPPKPLLLRPATNPMFGNLLCRCLVNVTVVDRALVFEVIRHTLIIGLVPNLGPMVRINNIRCLRFTVKLIVGAV